MVQTYEEILRRLLAEAEDYDRLYAYRLGPKSPRRPAESEIATHDLYNHIRRVVTPALQSFHPGIE